MAFLPIVYRRRHSDLMEVETSSSDSWIHKDEFDMRLENAR